jgi:hypothetical protein
MSALQQAAHHGAAHVAEADEADLGGGLKLCPLHTVSFSIGDGDGPPPR